ncbi:MAG: hypothetical protein ACRENN_08170 [Candidatus Eiseniibacteriota bacterium]
MLLVVLLAFAVSSSPIQGKAAPCDILIQSTTDVNAELAPCG